MSYAQNIKKLQLENKENNAVYPLSPAQTDNRSFEPENAKHT